MVISIDALSSEWVQDEVRIALDEAQRRDDGYKVISVVLPGVKAGLLKLLFPSEPFHIFVDDTPTGLSDAMPKIFAALGEQLPEDWESAKTVEVAPVEELILELTDPDRRERWRAPCESHRRIDLQPRRQESCHHQPTLSFHRAAGTGGIGGDPLVYRKILSMADRCF